MDLAHTRLLGDVVSDAVIRCRIEHKLKADPETSLNKLGLSVSDVIHMTFRQIVARRGLPFDVKIPSAETIARHP